MLQLQIKSDTPDLEIVKNLVKSAINAEIKTLKRSIEKSNKILKEFEVKYQISSDLFLSDWTAEDLEGRDDEDRLVVEVPDGLFELLDED